VLTVYVLAVGVKGLQLAGAPTWVPDLFNGVALLLAVGIAQLRRRAPRPDGRSGWAARLSGRRAAPQQP
jgi:ribose transport system permease protein